MIIIVRFSAKQEAKALPLLVRDSPGTILPNRTYLLSEEAVRMLIEKGIRFTEIGRHSKAPSPGGVLTGERI